MAETYSYTVSHPVFVELVPKTKRKEKKKERVLHHSGISVHKWEAGEGS